MINHKGIPTALQEAKSSPPAGPLGTITNNSSAVPELGDSTLSHSEQSRQLRFILQAAARELLPDQRVAWCLRRALPKKDHVNIRYSGEQEQAYYQHLMTCKSLWECPVCAARISEQRRRKLRAGLASREGDLFSGLMTPTAQHHAGESAETVKKRYKAALDRFMSGRWWKAFRERWRIQGYIRSIEPTDGENGWHIHSHIMIVSDSWFTPKTLLLMQIEGSQRWRDCVEAVGGYASEDYGFDVSAGNYAEYIDKIHGVDTRWGAAEEVTKAVNKRGKQHGRTMMQLLYDYALNDDKRAGRRWQEITLAMKGTKHLTYSQGFWDLFDLSDWEAEQQLDDGLGCEQDLLMAALTLDQWRVVVRQDKRWEVLQVAGDGDIESLHDYLRKLGVEGVIAVHEPEQPTPDVVIAPVSYRVVTVDLDDLWGFESASKAVFPVPVCNSPTDDQLVFEGLHNG